jgi:hypothetical protein
LEDQNRSLKRTLAVVIFAGAIAAGILFVMTLACRESPMDVVTLQRMLTQIPTIEAPRFVLRDTKGNARCIWSVSEKDYRSPSLRFLDEDGSERAGMYLHEDGGAAVFLNGRPPHRAGIHLNTGNTNDIVVHDAGQARGSIGVHGERGSVFMFSNHVSSLDIAGNTLARFPP